MVKIPLVVGGGYLSNSFQRLLREKNINYEFIPFRSLAGSQSTKTYSNHEVFHFGIISRRVGNSRESYKANINAINELLSLLGDDINIYLANSIDVFGKSADKISLDLNYCPFDYYSEAKVEIESLINSRYKTYSLYMPGLYGENIEEGSVISRMIKSAINNSNISLTSPEITRAFVRYEYCSKVFYNCMANKALYKDDSFIRLLPHVDRSRNLKEYAEIIKRAIEAIEKNDIKIQHDDNIDTSGGRSKNQSITSTSPTSICPPSENLPIHVESFVMRELERL